MLNILISIALFLLATTNAFAHDINVVCDTGGCTPDNSSAIFTADELWYPGMTQVKTIHVTNNSSDPLTVVNTSKNSSSTGMLDEVFDFQIDHFGGPTIFQNKLSAFLNSSSTPLISLSGNSTAVLVYTASMPAELGNEYQDKTVKFDLVLNFSGGHEDQEERNSEDNNNGGGEPGPSKCDQTTPTPISNLSITQPSPNSVTLSWSSVTPVTHYALIFTRLSDGAKYGSINIGSGNSYTINNLSGFETYEFEVFGVNGCAPGGSAKVRSTIQGVATTGRPIGLDGSVLGDTSATESAEIDSLPLPPSPEILGSNVCSDPWWKTVFIVLAVSLPLLVTKISRKNKYKLNFISLVLLFVLAIMVDTSYFCDHNLWPLLIVISYLLSGFVFHRR